MKKVWIRTLKLLPAILLLLSLGACTGNPGPAERKTSGFHEFQTTYYHGPDYVMDETVLQQILDCGISHIPFMNIENAESVLALMREKGMTVNAFTVSEISSQIIRGNGGFDQSLATQEYCDAVVKKYVEMYADYDDVITGWDLTDEPNCDQFKYLARLVNSFRKYAPGKEIHINLFPSYASPEQLGCDTYDEYIERFCEEVDPSYLSYDYYHFRSVDETTQTESDYCDNLETIRSAGLKYGKDYMQIILLTKHLGYADVNEYQLDFETNVALTYGAKRISYFTYYTETALEDQGWSDACMNSKGELTDHYYAVQKLNKRIQPLGDELFNKTSTAVFRIPYTDRIDLSQTKSTLYSSYGKLGEVDGRDFVIGFFDDDSFMITNMNYIAYGENYEVNHITFREIKKGLQYFNTETAAWCDAEKDGIAYRGDDGLLRADFKPGEGILFRVK